MKETITKIDSCFIIQCLEKKFPQQRMYAIESFIFGEESDFITFDYRDKTHEFEIKVSRSDFKADFKKLKHITIPAIIQGKETVTIPGREMNATCSIEGIIKSFEFCKKSGREYVPRQRTHFLPWYSTVGFYKPNPNNVPNRFSFVVPVGMIDKSEVPEYAGLYYCYPDGEIICIKRAKSIHRKKFERWRKLSLTLFYRNKNHRKHKFS